MGTIAVSLPADGTTAEVADYNTPITTIVDEINGSLDNANIATGAAIAGSKLADASVTPAKRTGGFAVTEKTFANSTGSQTVSGVTGFDFVPKYVKVFQARPLSTNARFSEGVAWYNGSSYINYGRGVSSTTSDARGTTSSTYCAISLSASTGTNDFAASVTGWSSGSITFNVATASADTTTSTFIIEAYG